MVSRDEIRNASRAQQGSTAEGMGSARPAAQPNLRLAWILAGVLPFGVFAAGALVGSLWESVPASFVYILLIAAAAAFADLRLRRIPNYLTYTALAWGLVLNALVSLVVNWWHVESALADLGCIGVVRSAGGLATAFAIMIAIYVVTGVGAGDVKLAAAMGAWIGPERSLLLICYAYILAAVGSLCLLILKHGPWQMLLHGRELLLNFLILRAAPKNEQNRHMYEMSVPLGLYFALATPLAVLDLPQRFTVV